MRCLEAYSLELEFSIQMRVNDICQSYVFCNVFGDIDLISELR